MTLDEFLHWDDGTDIRYELVDGCALAMAPPLVAHAMIVGNLIRAIGGLLRPGCSVLGEAGLVIPGRKDAYYQADVVVTRAPQPQGARWVHEPTVVIEVLSPSTTGRDRDTKVPDYRSLPSVTEIVVVSTQRRHAELWRREGDSWRVHDLIGDARLELSVTTSAISLVDVYAGTG